MVPVDMLGKWSASLTEELTWRRGQLLMIIEPKPIKGI
jgi:hypothetical protein